MAGTSKITRSNAQGARRAVRRERSRDNGPTSSYFDALDDDDII